MQLWMRSTIAKASFGLQHPLHKPKQPRNSPQDSFIV